jgi:uncharacterized membrane protein
MTTNRVEAFSDGVFAIAITLLVLEIRPPAGEDLGRKLLDLWPSYFAYVVSFLTIGIIWVNHHATFDRIVRVDRPLLFSNLMLLMSVSFLPFPTAVVADRLREGGDKDIAAALYAGSLLVMGACFFITWRYAAHRRGLVTVELTPPQVRALVRRNAVGQGGYVAALAMAFVSAPVSLAICGLVAIYYVFPGRLPET